MHTLNLGRERGEGKEREKGKVKDGGRIDGKLPISRMKERISLQILQY